MITISGRGCGAGMTTTTTWGSNVGHVVPVYTGALCTGSGGRSGLPQRQRARGTPNSSTSTAVPACSTDWIGYAAPLLNPWLVTRVSERRMTGVSIMTYCRITAGSMPCTWAHAAASAGCDSRNSTILTWSQAASSSVPP